MGGSQASKTHVSDMPDGGWRPPRLVDGGKPEAPAIHISGVPIPLRPDGRGGDDVRACPYGMLR